MLKRRCVLSWEPGFATGATANATRGAITFGDAVRIGDPDPAGGCETGRLRTIVAIAAISGTPDRDDAVEPADDTPGIPGMPASSAPGSGSRSRISRADRGRFSTSFSSARITT